MIIRTRMHTRPNLHTQFFAQMHGDPNNIPWSLKSLFVELWPKFRNYDPRYTKDVLFKLIISEFDDQETYDAFCSDSENVKRENLLQEEYKITGVSLVDEIRQFDKDSQELQDYYNWVLAYTWPAKCFLIRSSWDQAPDRFLDEVYKEKPDNDGLDLCLTHKLLL